MIRNLLLVLSLASALLLFAGLGLAQDQKNGGSIPSAPPPNGDEMPAFTVEDLAAFAKEPPLTQADIDVFFKLAGSLEAEAEVTEKIVQETGLSEVRLNYILTKVQLGIFAAMGAPDDLSSTGGVPKMLLPSAEEVELIKTNLARLEQ